jgi:putative membrane protein
MGSADVVPGVSGGTVALVLGIYPRLIDNVRQGARVLGRIARADLRGAIEAVKAVEWLFLVPLLAGIGIAILTLAHSIEGALENHPVAIAGLFFGLVVGSVVVTARMLKRDLPRLAVLAAVAVAAFLLLGLRTGEAEAPALWFVFIAGAIAICAMILPGVSGSFLLLMMGMYDYVISAVTARDLAVLGVFAVGAVLGLGGFSSVLHWALHRYPDTVLAGLVGLMVGSLRVLWPWPDGTETIEMSGPEGPVLLPVLLGLLGAGVVMGVSWVASTREQRADMETAGA